MKEEFYCLALRKKVTTKVTGVVKKKGYSLKGLYKEGGKEYKVTKTCSKDRAEEVAEKLGLTIEQQVVEAKASETVVPADDFMPEGDGKVIGQNTAGVETAIEGTETTVTSNTTPLHAESDDDDNIGPMSMAAESPPTGSDIIDAFAGPAIEKMIEEDDSDYEIDDYLLLIDGKIREVSGNTEMDVIEKEKPDSYHIVKIIGVKPYKIKTVDFGAEDEKKNCGCGQDPCVTYGSETDEPEEINPTDYGIKPSEEKSAEVGGGGMDYAIEPDHWLRLQAHPEWKEWAPEVNVSREQNYWIITCSQVSADDILELIIATADESVGPMEIPNSNSKALTLGFGLVGLAASLILLRRFSKEE